MIVWGGTIDGGEWFDTGGRYNPGTNSWTPTSIINVPPGQYLHTAVWTGSHMIVWGGYGESNFANTGGRYNPSMNSWTTTSTANAPTARSSHTAVWTGTEMIVWGGFNSGAFNTGGRYDPSMDSWMPTGSNNAPSARISHTAVWTGSEMIVWAGTVPTPTSSTLVADIIWLWITGRLRPSTTRRQRDTFTPRYGRAPK